MKAIPLIGRILFSFQFLNGGMFHFTPDALAYASAQKVPFPEFLVPFSGIMAIVGGLSIALGLKGKWGAWLIVLFLIPVTIIMHNFWVLIGPAERAMQTAMFTKNLSMMGGAFLITYFGTGPLSLTNKGSDK